MDEIKNAGENEKVENINQDEDTAAVNDDIREENHLEETAADTGNSDDDIDDFSDDAEIIKDETTEDENKEDDTEQVDESAAEEQTEEIPKKAKINIPWKKIGIGVGSAAAVLALIYVGGTIYYSSHFYPGTRLFNFDCSNLTVKKAEEKIKHELEDYTYTIRERGGKEEYIKGSDIDLQCTTLAGIDKAKENQNPFGWLTNIDGKYQNIDIGVSYDEDALYRAAENLDCTVESVEGMDGSYAGVYYENGSFHVKNNDEKNIISFSHLFSALKAGVYGLYTDISLEDEGIYVPMGEEDHMKAALEELNRYTAANITYTKDSETFVVNGDLISTWVTCNPDYSVTLNEEKAAEYVSNLAGSYDTIGKQRPFVTSGGQSINVGGGDYGWRVAQKTETAALLGHIRNGETVVKEPAYDQKAGSHGPNNDFPNTYVEVSIGGQHLWFYKDGSLEVSTNMVSGNPYKGNGTPAGVYRVKYKDKNVVLKGEGYETPVTYWMPFNGGIGLHDANWRGAFGGSIYLGGGSHGCINLPPSAAAAVYAKLSPGDPVIVY